MSAAGGGEMLSAGEGVWALASENARTPRIAAGTPSNRLIDSLLLSNPGDELVGQVVRDRDREVVLRDLPGVPDAQEDARAPARAHVRRVERLVEPGDVPIRREVDPARGRPEAPGLPPRELRSRPLAELVARPPLGAVGTEEDGVGREVGEVLLLVRRGRRGMPVVENRADRALRKHAFRRLREE